MKLILKEFIVDAELDKMSGGLAGSCRPVCITPPRCPQAPCRPVITPPCLPTPPHCDPRPQPCAPRGCGGHVAL